MTVAPPAYADSATKQYTDIVTDLSVDPSFDISQYPEKDGDYTIDLFQIAESSDNELYVYCYTPCRTFADSDGLEVELPLTQISIAMSSDIKQLSHSLHGLKEVNRYKTLTKYVVNGIAVDTKPTKRFYDVPMLQRKNKNGEEEAEEVGKLWTVENIEGGVKYNETHKQTIKIENPVAGAVRYQKDKVPANWGKDGVDNHFIAFDTDLPIDDLLEADVEYMTVAIGEDVGAPKDKCILGTEYQAVAAVSIILDGNSQAFIPEAFAKRLRNYAIENEKYISGNVTVKKNQSYTFGTGGWFSEDKYSWNRIMHMRDFKTTMQNGEVCGISGSYTVDELQTRKWVLCYRETPYDQQNGWFEQSYGGYWYDFDIVVLRLKFETNGTVYDLGTVSNKVNQTELLQGNKPKDPLDWLYSIIEWLQDNWYWIVICIIAIVALIVLSPFLPIIISGLFAVLKAVGHCLLLLLKGLWWLISAPFRLIVHLIQGGG